MSKKQLDKWQKQQDKKMAQKKHEMMVIPKEEIEYYKLLQDNLDRGDIYE